MSNEVQIDCKEADKPESKRLGSYEIVVLLISIVILILTAVSLPSSYQAAAEPTLLLAGVAIGLVLILRSQINLVRYLRYRVRFLFSDIFWRKFLKVDQARKELVIWHYDRRIEAFPARTQRNAFVSYDEVKIEVTISASTRALNPLITDTDQVRRLTNTPVSYWNSVIYRLETMKNSNGVLALTFGPGCYLDYVGTCESVARETDGALKKISCILPLARRRLHRPSEEYLIEFYSKAERHLSERRKFAGSKEGLLNPATKCLKMGISNVTLLRNCRGDGYIFLLGLRSGRILEYPNTYHVVPAGTFEPSKKAYYYDPLEGDPYGSVLRELYEECFVGEKKPIYDKDPNPLSEIVKEPELDFIYANRNDTNQVEFRTMGVYFDYYTPKVEMTTCLVVHDSEYLRNLERGKKLISNWEYGSEILKKQFSKSEVRKWIGSDTMLPIGAIALEDATRVFPSLLRP